MSGDRIIPPCTDERSPDGRCIFKDECGRECFSGKHPQLDGTADIGGNPMSEADVWSVWEQAITHDPDGIVVSLSHTALTLYERLRQLDGSADIGDRGDR